MYKNNSFTSEKNVFPKASYSNFITKKTKHKNDRKIEKLLNKSFYEKRSATNKKETKYIYFHIMYKDPIKLCF